MPEAPDDEAVVEGVLLTTDYITVGQQAWVRLWITGEDGARTVVDPSFEPYFYAVPAEGVTAAELADELASLRSSGRSPKRAEVVTRIEDLEDKRVVRVVTQHPQHVPPIRNAVRKHEAVASTREDDVLFANRYLVDNQLRPLTWTRVRTRPSQARPGEHELVHVEQDPDEDVDLDLLAFDLEVYNPRVTPDPTEDPIVVASLADNRGYEEVITKGDDEDDRELVATLAKRIRDKDPDVIVTYNGDNFDWPYLVDRAEEHGFDLRVGRDGSPPEIRQAGRRKAVTVTGRGNMDGYQMARRDVPDVKVKTLERVAEHLGVDGETFELEAQNMAEIWDDPDRREELLDYAINDARNALGIAESLLGLQIGLCQRTFQDLSDGSRMGRGRQADWYLLGEAHKRGILAPDKNRHRGTADYEGGVVLEPPAGIHEDVVYLDFSSMYPSIMVAHNVSPDTYVPPGLEVDADVHEAPDVGHAFRTEPDGFFKRLLKELIDQRRSIKDAMRELDPASQEHSNLKVQEQAIKVLTNAFYGYMGWSGARWQSIPCAEATTAWGRHFIQRAVEMAEDEDLEVLYGDSLTEERFVTVRDPEGRVKPMNMTDLFDEASAPVAYGEKETAPLDGYEALSVDPSTRERRWAPIRAVIRHEIQEPVYRVWQKHGETRVTQDHSIMTLGPGGLAETRPEDIGLRELVPVEEVQRGDPVTRLDLYELLDGYEFTLEAKGKTRRARVKLDGDRVTFGWQNRARPISIPRFIEVGSPEFESLCRLVGAYVAEGSASTPETTESRMGASLASSDEAWLKQLQGDYHRLFDNAKASIVRSTKGTRTIERADGTVLEYEDKTRKLQMMNQMSAVFFRQLCGQRSAGKRLPRFVFNVDEEHQRLVLETIVQGDGSTWPDERYSDAYHEENFSYTTRSLALASGVSVLLRQLGINYSIQFRPSKRTYTLKTSSASNARLETRVREEPYEGYVYDLDVEETDTFVDACGQILVHNTDSVMVFAEDTIDRFIEQVNEELPIELEVEAEFEALFFTGAKKRYAGRTRDGKTLIRGLEVRRGDWCPYAKDVQRRVIETLLTERDAEEATLLAQEAIEDLREGNVPLDELLIHKTLTRDPSRYDGKQPHAMAVEKAQEREPGFEAPVGSKIGYVIVEDDSTLVSERARLPDFLAEHERVDSDYYIENQVVPAAERVLGYFGVDADELKGRPSQASLEEWF